MAVLTGAIGAHRIGSWPIGGLHPLVIVPPVEVSGLAGFAFNDRYQLILVGASGASETRPELRYWSVQPPDWSGVLPAGDKGRLVPFFALDEHGHAVIGATEHPVYTAPQGQEMTITGVMVEFVCRPFAISDFDGGLNSNEVIGLDVYVAGFAQPDIHTFASPPRETGVVLSETESFRITAEQVGVAVWPNYMAHFFPCSIDTAIREVRVGISMLRHVQVVAFELYGNHVPSRYT